MTTQALNERERRPVTRFVKNATGFWVELETAAGLERICLMREPESGQASVWFVYDHASGHVGRGETPSDAFRAFFLAVERGGPLSPEAAAKFRPVMGFNEGFHMTTNPQPPPPQPQPTPAPPPPSPPPPPSQP